MLHYRHLTGWLILWCLLLSLQGRAQPYYNQRAEYIKGNSVWIFGRNVGFDFNSGNPVALQSGVFNYEGVASVADRTTGQLLFYSTGGLCYNRNHSVMPNGWGLRGNTFFVQNLLPGDEDDIDMDGQTTQGVCIVPLIGSTDQYYLFSLSGTSNGGPTVNGTLFYSIVDMSLNGGMGDVVAAQKNIALSFDTLSEAMIAVPGNNCDVWLIVHDYVNPRFKAYHITAQGIDPTPVVSTVAPHFSVGNNAVIGGLGSSVPGTFQTGGMTVSPDRKHLVICSWQPPCIYGYAPNATGTLLCRFDPETGTVSDGFEVEDGQIAYVAAFSPDNSKLYIFNDDNMTSASQLLQFDVTVHDSMAVSASKTVIADRPFPDVFYLKQYNGKIYVNYSAFGIPSSGPTEFVGVIHNPDQQGAACNYQEPGPAFVPATYGNYSLPNDVVYAYPPDTATTTQTAVLCTHNGSGSMTLTAPQGYQGYLWSDGGGGNSLSITAPGTYWVLSQDPCHSRLDTFIITQNDMTFSLGPDTSICGPAAYILHVSQSGAICLWQDNSTDNQYAVTASGTYHVLVSRNGCTTSDTVNITYTDLDVVLGSDQHFCKGTPIDIDLQVEVPPGTNVTWNTGHQGNDLHITDTGTYWVTAVKLACKDSDTLKVSRDICQCGFNVPTAFSPNGDGINDRILPVIESGCPLSQYTFNIYNRFGTRVYSGSRYPEGWDGTYNGYPADVGTYMYELRFEGGTQKQQYYSKGDLVLIR